MSKEMTALEQSKEIIRKHCEKQAKPCHLMLDLEKPFSEIEAALKSYDQIKKCHLVAIPRMSNKTSIVDELLSLQEAIKVMTTILHYSYTNRRIVKQAFDEGWINEEQYQLMIETFGYYNCTGKEEPNES